MVWGLGFGVWGLGSGVAGNLVSGIVSSDFRVQYSGLKAGV